MSKIITVEDVRCRVSKRNLKKEIIKRINLVINASTNQPNLINFKVNINKIRLLKDINKKTCLEKKMEHYVQDIEIKVYLFGLDPIDYINFKNLIEKDEMLSIIDFKIDGIYHISPIIEIRKEVKRLNNINGVKFTIKTKDTFLGIYANRKIKEKFLDLIFEISYDALSVDTKIIDKELLNFKNKFKDFDISYNKYFTISEKLLKDKYNFTKSSIDLLRNNRSISYPINTVNIKDLDLKKYLMNLYYENDDINKDFNFFINEL